MSCCSGCSSNLSNINLTGPSGAGVVNITTDILTNPGFTNITFVLSNGGTLGPVSIPDGVDGVSPQSINHVSFFQSNIVPTNVPNKPGSIDTYRVWGDVAETILIGSFTVYHGVDNTTSDTVTNVGAGAGLYITGTDFPFEMRTLTSVNNTLTITQNANTVNLDVVNNVWYSALPSGFISSTNPVFKTGNLGGGFTAANNAGGMNTLAFRLDPITKKVIMKGVVQLSGGTGIAFEPTSSTTNTIIEICSVPAQFDVTNVTTATYFSCHINSSINSACIAYIANSTLYLIVCNRTNQLLPTSNISFENSMYSRNDI